MDRQLVQAQQSRTRRSSHDQSSLGAFQTVVSQPPVPGLPRTKHRTGCRSFQAGRFDVSVLVCVEEPLINTSKRIAGKTWKT